MIRLTSLMLLTTVAALLAMSSARGGLPVAPPPREIRPDGSRDPAPTPEVPAKPEDPAAVVDRIINNSKDVGDKLARTDTGTVTRKTQDKILSDIDSLINRQENPPPPKNDKKDQKDQKDQKDKQDQKQNKNNKPKDNQGMPNSGMPMGNMGMGGNSGEMPKSGGRRPRMGSDQNKEPQQPQGQPDPKEQKKGGQPKESSTAKDPTGAAGGKKGGKVKALPSLPFNEDVAKDVWGHLPDKLRRQMTQYYKEDVMPKYSDLLRLYYSSLSDQSSGPNMPRK